MVITVELNLICALIHLLTSQVRFLQHSHRLCITLCYINLIIHILDRAHSTGHVILIQNNNQSFSIHCKLRNMYRLLLYDINFEASRQIFECIVFASALTVLCIGLASVSTCLYLAWRFLPQTPLGLDMSDLFFCVPATS